MLFKAERLSATFEALGDVINYHHHGEVSRGNPEKDKGDVVQHRLAFIGVTGFTSRLLKQLIPVQQVAKSCSQRFLFKSNLHYINK